MRFIKEIEWPTLAMLGFCYTVWAVAGFGIFPDYPVLALGIMAVAAALFASLQHEVLHGHPTRNAHVNEFLVSLPLVVFYPYRRFKQMHLRHHNDERLTDPYDDPESWFRSAADYGRFGAPVRWMLRINNTFAGRLLLGPGLMVVAFYAGEPARLWRGERGIRQAWLNHAAGLAVLLFVVYGLMGINPLLYVATVAYGGTSIIAIRTYCEHRWDEDSEGRTVIVERGGIFGLLFLNNNLHFVHHKLPRAPWYRLPAIYRTERAEWLSRNGGYVFSNYWDIARTFAFRAKDPVVHPVWRKEIEVVPADWTASTADVRHAVARSGPQTGCQAPKSAETAKG